MDETNAITERVPHTRSPKSPPPQPPPSSTAKNSSPVTDEKVVSGLSTLLVASIQEAKDKISQIEYVFCSQLYPNFQSTSKNSDAKRRRITELEHELDEGMTLQKNLLDLIRSKDSLLKTAVAKLESCESENAQLLGKIVDLEERLRLKVKDVEVLELKCDENEGLCRKLVEEVELLKCEVKDEKLKRNCLNEAYKRLKSQHVYLRKKVGLNEENMIRESESDLGKNQSPIVEQDVAIEDRNINMDVCVNAKVKIEIPDEDFEGVRCAEDITTN